MQNGQPFHMTYQSYLLTIFVSLALSGLFVAIANKLNFSFFTHEKEEVVNFLENTVIVERAGQNFIITKKELKKQGYTFPPYKKIKYFQAESEKDED